MKTKFLRGIALMLCVCMTLLCISCGGKTEEPEEMTEMRADINTVGLAQNLHGLKFIKDTSPKADPKKASDGIPAGEPGDGTPFVGNMDGFYNPDIPVCTYNVKDFGATGDGVTNDNPAIARALNAARKAGGGVVYIPEGTYLLSGSLVIPAAVTLRGDWVSPEEAAAGSKGTVLLATAGRGDPDAHSLFMVFPTGGVRNLTIYYPDQKPGDIKPYPPTFIQMTGDSFTVENVTIINPWRGFQIGPEWNELHYVHNVYMSPAELGVHLDFTTDIGRLEGVHISPKYWQENAIAPLTDEEKQTVADHMHENTTGILMYRSDWQYGYDVTIENCKVGLRIAESKRGAPNAQFMKFDIINCDTGVWVDQANPIGMAFTDFKITTTEPASYGIGTSDAFNTIVQFSSVQMEGPFRQPVFVDGPGGVTLVKSSITGWDSSKNFAATTVRGGVSFQECTFDTEKKIITAGSGSGGVSLLGCTFGENAEAEPEVVCGEGMTTVLVDKAPLNLAQPSGRQHVYRKNRPMPASKDLYDVTDFGAIANARESRYPTADSKGWFDCTEAFQNALNAAGKTGGTVYIPAGAYYLAGHLTVPAGVELRGVLDVPSHSCGYGTVLFTDWGKNDEKAEPFIVLSENAGVRGFMINYPDQAEKNSIPFPWAVQGRGINVWAVNVTFVNAYNCIDFGTYPSDNHYISYVSGAPIRRGIFVGSNASNGWVENVQFNPHYWMRTDYPNRAVDFPTFWHNQIDHLDAFILGYNESEHMLGNFVFASNKGMYFINQDGRGTNGTVIGHGSDGGECATYIEDLDIVEFINTELVAMESKNEKKHLFVDKAFDGTAAFYNSLVWGPTDYSVIVEGGNLILQQTNFQTQGRCALTVNGGNVDMTSSHAYINIRNAIVNKGAGTVNIIANIAKKPNLHKQFSTDSMSVTDFTKRAVVRDNWYR